MSFTAAVRSVLTQYVGFSGRARRSEYWWFALFSLLVSIVTSILDTALGTNFEGSSNGVIGLIVSLALLLPGPAVVVRRLHDTDRSGWWILIGLIPIIGWIVLLVFYVQNGTPGPNRFGPDPKDVAGFGPAA
ncbi:DUF805 domain-containing protein [Micromonospora sp. LOL_023]|uniref:DUF805 domain-containing protein n=1 Tax=Micromonospora sp. LOL_023 TaxID=3345418 RepID=UPI003A8A5BEA